MTTKVKIKFPNGNTYVCEDFDSPQRIAPTSQENDVSINMPDTSSNKITKKQIVDTVLKELEAEGQDMVNFEGYGGIVAMERALDLYQIYSISTQSVTEEKK